MNDQEQQLRQLLQQLMGGQKGGGGGGPSTQVSSSYGASSKSSDDVFGVNSEMDKWAPLLPDAYRGQFLSTVLKSFNPNNAMFGSSPGTQRAENDRVLGNALLNAQTQMQGDQQQARTQAAAQSPQIGHGGLMPSYNFGMRTPDQERGVQQSREDTDYNRRLKYADDHNKRMNDLWAMLLGTGIGGNK